MQAELKSWSARDSPAGLRVEEELVNDMGNAVLKEWQEDGEIRERMHIISLQNLLRNMEFVCFSGADSAVMSFINLWIS